MKAGTSINSSSSSRGFTLMEMVVVIFIISLVAAVVLPRLPSTAPQELRGSARKLAATIRYLGDLTITSKSFYRMHVGLGTDSLTIKHILADGSEEDAADPFLQQQLISPGVTVVDVVTQQGKNADGEETIGFGIAGIDRYAVFHLKGRNGDFFTVTAYPVSGKVTVAEGYQEEKP